MASPITAASARELVAVGVVRGARLVYVPGGFVIVLQAGLDERVIQKKEGGEKTYKDLNSAAKYLKDLNINNFVVDINNWRPEQREL